MCCCWLILHYSPFLEQTRCTLVICGSEWVTVAFYHAVLNIHWSGVLSVLSGCHVKLLPFQCTFCAHHTTMYTIQPCASLHCHFIPNHIHKVHVCLGVTCHLHFWPNDQNLLCATAHKWLTFQYLYHPYCSSTGVEQILKCESLQKLPWRRKSFCHSCQDSNLWPFSHEADALTAELSPHHSCACRWQKGGQKLSFKTFVPKINQNVTWLLALHTLP